MRVVVIAPSGPIREAALEAGLATLRSYGFEAVVHPHTLCRTPLTAGTDEQRLAAVLDAAYDPRAEVVWCARGGYGAARLLPMLEAATVERGQPPRKLLIGFSDVTALHAFARQRWGWATLHGLVIAQNEQPAWPETAAVVRREKLPDAHDLQWWHAATDVTGEVVGGNLALIASLCGTPNQLPLAGRILMLEDVGEPLYRIDRLLEQVQQAADGRPAAVVLGDFNDIGETRGLTLREVAVDWARRWGVPLASGLQTGHAGHCRPVPLGGEATIDPAGRFEITQWD